MQNFTEAIKLAYHFYKKNDRVTEISVLLCLLSSVTITIFINMQSSKLPYKLPLFYSLPWGEPQLAALSQFNILSGIIFLTTFINLLISWHLHLSQLVLKRILAISSLLVTLLLTITSIKIIYTFI